MTRITPSPCHPLTLSLLLTLTILSLCLPTTVQAEESVNGERLFTLKVLPLLKEKCFACHGGDPKAIKGQYDLTSRAGLLKGGESGDPSLVVGKPDESLFVEAIEWASYEMPPKENDRLTPAQIEIVRNWISAGAPWPDKAVQKQYLDAERAVVTNEEGTIVSTSGGLADEWTYRRYQPDDIWAFQPVVKPAVPKTSTSTENPIDAFVRSRLEEAGFSPASEADPVTLIRRATLDLIGLPPTPAQIASFQAAWKQNSERAWSDLIDRLLASPHYGERWGQHWLDVVRYADTGGYSNDYERSNAWRYRDYVIRAFNQDKPYDQFVIEQLAGDELADESVRHRSGGDEKTVHETRLSGDYNPQVSEWLVATGFLRMGPWDNAMVMPEEARQIYLDDVVNSVGQSFLSTTMRCFKCHDHKFDPLPTRDYYRMYAAFSTTQMAERSVPFLEEERKDGFAEGKAFVEQMLAYAVSEKEKIKAKQEQAERAWYRERDLEFVPENKRGDVPDEEKPPRHAGLNHVEQGQLKVREQDEWIWKRSLERYQPMVQSVYDGGEYHFSWDNARYLRVRKNAHNDKIPETTILTGGSLEAPGQPVQPGVLSAVSIEIPDAPNDDPYVISNEVTGRRLALAKWIADPRNPLTTRSIVNRVWQHHFGNGLAGNPNNFGAKGSKPTHPELLDWLASEFVEREWKLKSLHRQIMLSATYRQAASHPQIDKLRTDDPNNHLLAYANPRRLTAEEIRDSLLAMTGELNPTVGGLPVMPEINMEVALQPRMIQFSIAPAYQPSPTPAKRNRRSIYAYRVRGQADPFLELFNQPNPNDSCEARDAASVTPQVFTLLNSDVITDRSIALAQRLENEQETLEKQLDRAFQIVLGRTPSETELLRLHKYVREMQQYHADVTPEPVVYPTEITRSLVEEFTGKPFQYQEILPAFENYQPDTKPADVSPATRALADACLLLFNSNEFIYVY